MRINKYVIRTGILGLGLVIISVAGVATAVKLNEQQSISLKSIQKQCSRLRESDGFGRALIGSVHLKNESIEISQPCKVILKDGASLQLTNVTLKTNNLVILNQKNAKKSAHLIINKSNLSSPKGGFQTQFKTSASSVSVKDSSFSYPLSVGFAVGEGDEDTSAALRVNNSTFASLSSESEGINLVTSGKAIIKNNKFEFSDDQSQALLLGSECQLIDNINANTRCHGP